MNKKNLINKVSEVLDSKKDAQTAVDCTIKPISNHAHKTWYDEAPSKGAKDLT